MIILPAIDIKDGRCVRLLQGDYSQVTTFSDDPVEMALKWQAAGATWLHLVDLDGAKEGKPVNRDVIREIRAATHVKIEVGGGLRALDDMESMLELDVERIILGTAALKQRDLLAAALKYWSDCIAVGIDARDGHVATEGWLQTSDEKAVTLAKTLEDLGVQRFIYTDIMRDGALSGPNLSALDEMKQATKAALIASGGVSSLDDLRALAAKGVEGAIVGRAIYTGAVDLAQAIQEIARLQ